MIARGWIVSGTILAVGLTTESEVGLSAAVLFLATFTVYADDGPRDGRRHQGRARAPSAAAPLPAGGTALVNAIKRMSRGKQVALGLGTLLVLSILIGVLFPKEPENNDYQPQNEFKLDPWIEIKIGADRHVDQQGRALPGHRRGRSTVWTMIYIAKRMQEQAEPRPDRRRGRLRPDEQQHHAREHGRAAWRRSGSRSSRTLFLFIWFSNLIGYIPLPTNTEHKIELFGLEIPSFALYAATANISVPLVLTLDRLVQLPRRGHPGQGRRSATSRAGSRPGVDGPRGRSRSSSSR